MGKGAAEPLSPPGVFRRGRPAGLFPRDGARAGALRGGSRVRVAAADSKRQVANVRVRGKVTRLVSFFLPRGGQRLGSSSSSCPFGCQGTNDREVFRQEGNEK